MQKTSLYSKSVYRFKPTNMEVCKIFLGLLVVLQINDNYAQTCNQIKYTTINDVRRSAAYKRTANSKLCDRGFIKNDNWYRFDSVAGSTIPEKNPGNGFCGTHVPIWLQGTHPTTVNVVVDAKACAAVPFIPPLGCGISYNIKVINCGSYYLYRLKEPRQCDLAYCAGEKLPDTSCSVTGETLPVCPGAIPRVSVGVGFKDENSEEVRLRCFWESPGNLTNVEYQARWYGDIKDLQPKIQRNFTGLELPEFLFEPTIVNLVKNKNGYEFHKNVYCTVRARYKTGTWSKWVASKRIYTGIQVFPTFIPINDCGEKDREVIITLRPNLPIRVKPINIDIARPTSKLIDEICVVGEKEGFHDCGLVFEPNHRVGRPIRFKLMTSCGTGDKSKILDAVYELQHSYHDLQNINRFWVNHQFPIIKISRRKFKKQQCWSTGDPHFQTFDGRRYDFYGRGTFLLYRNKHYGTEIQVRHRACNGGTPSCNCGVAIRENLFYKIYDMCYTTPGRPWWENNVRSRLYTYQLRDFKLSRFYSSIKQQGSTAKYEITLPSGVKVIVDRRNWGLNLYVWAPADPDHPSEGLCGNNNENPSDDFGQWNTENQFGEHWRIRTYLTQFDYKGNKFEEDQLDDGCDQKICVCSRGTIKLCGSDAEQICFPELGSKDARAHHQGSGIGECKNRPKRALALDDDTVDDQDTIPSFNPRITKVNLTLTWPTPSGITKDNVTQFCEHKLLYSKAGEACGQVSGVNVASLVQQCITDIQATEDFSWAAGNFAALETSCIANIFNNISSFKNTSDGSIELDTDVLTSLCPNDCSDNGNCTNSTCTCYEDYTAADCSISLKASPLVFDIRKSGLCDRRRRPCRNVGIFGFPLLDSENLTCHVQEYKIINSTWSPSNSISLYPGQLVDLTEVKCALPESPVNIGDYGNNGVTAAGLKIAVSNNRINASKDSMLFITYDSVCQDCNTTTGCRLRTDACFISGHCFAINVSNPLDWCQQCMPEMSTTSWSERKDNKEPTFTTSQVLYAFKGKQLRVQLSAIDPENRTFQYSFAQNETLGASLTKDGLFKWTKNTDDPTVFMFNVTDECGAYSVLKTSVVIKQCPCQNSGECFPDYRYLDGAGNFTCSCPDQYTGSLCEVDVDECAASKPCNNGTCRNEQPGFSCTCFDGYTGNRCQTEINECALNPCFIGVTCTDMVAGYSCGACPSGYSGNGVNCTRMDGKTDECINNPKVCHSDAKCEYHNGSYVCQCSDGYNGDGKINCTDVNECSKSQELCTKNAKCLNTHGSYWCRCSEGYTGDGAKNCTDIDECEQPAKVCHPHANCSNVVGSYSCQCTDGYSGDGKQNCTDIDECQQSPCYPLASCSNTEGSYSCLCKDGYTGDGHMSCTDINECLQTPNVCHPHANCSNVAGSFSCQCRDGYTGDGKMNCTDIDECQQSPCYPLGICSNSEGSYSCLCKDGYTGNGQMSCTDINECLQIPKVCHPNANCSNVVGSFSCQCTDGYTGDGKINCTDIDECRQSPCHSLANCKNIEGSYSCQCRDGYTGDGQTNCTENQPPKFFTPNAVLAILNEEFRIQIKAKDPESQDFACSLVSNGSLVTARITKQGLLTISSVKENGTVFIQVEDDMGAKNTIILHVNTMQCPCEHNGKCNRKKKIQYPVQPSDYLCQCEEPYTGDLCGIRPNLCDEERCFPGLKCSLAQNSEGFACEECPPLFEGDGKNCVLKPNQEKISVKSKLKLTNQEWSEQLTKKTSKEYKSLVSQLVTEIRKLYQHLAGFSYVIIKRLSRGSVIVEFELIFTKEIDDPLQPLNKVAESGKLGNMTFEIEELDDEDDASTEDKILGLDKTIFIVIVAGVVVLILIIIVTVCLRKRQTHRGDVKLNKYVPHIIANNPEGTFHETEEPGSNEEIDLKVLDNDTVCVEEKIKLKP